MPTMPYQAFMCASAPTIALPISTLGTTNNHRISALTSTIYCNNTSPAHGCGTVNGNIRKNKANSGDERTAAIAIGPGCEGGATDTTTQPMP